MRPTLQDGIIRIETLFELDDSIIAGIVLIVREEIDHDLHRKVALF